jgi:hypothetical protein
MSHSSGRQPDELSADWEQAQAQTRAAKRWALVFLGGAGLLAVATFTWLATVVKPDRDTPGDDVMQFCLQVVALAAVGALGTTVTFRVQHAHAEQSRLAAEQRELTRLENRRADDRIAEQRSRLDERVSQFLTETLDAYHGVKRTRRILEAETNASPEPMLTRTTYERVIAELSDHQLVFESLKRRAPLIEERVPAAQAIVAKGRDEKAEARPPGVQPRSTPAVEEPLRKHYKELESYLNTVIGEGKDHLHEVPTEAGVPLRRFSRLEAFVKDTYVFKVKVSRYVDAVTECLETDLLTSTEPSQSAGVSALRTAYRSRS